METEINVTWGCEFIRISAIEIAAPKVLGLMAMCLPTDDEIRKQRNSVGFVPPNARIRFIEFLV
jgi:hypothetical protein